MSDGKVIVWQGKGARQGVARRGSESDWWTMAVEHGAPLRGDSRDNQ